MVEKARIAAEDGCSVIFAKWRSHVPHLLNGSLGHPREFSIPPKSRLVQRFCSAHGRD